MFNSVEDKDQNLLTAYLLYNELTSV